MSNSTVTTEEYIERLDGITYAQWAKLRIVMERSFNESIKNYQNKLLVNTSETKRLYKSQFGGCSI